MGTGPHDAADEYAEAQTGTDPDLSAPLPVVVAEAVRVMEHPPRTLVSDQLPVSSTAARIAGEHRHRATLTLAPSGAAVYVGGPGVTVGTGFRVADGGALTLTTTAAVYAVAATDAVVYVLSEVREG